MTAQPSLAAGTAAGCAQYYAHYLPAINEQPQANEAIPWQSLFSCESVADRFNVDVEKLLRWNPSLSSEDCVLQPGLNYCVVRIETTDKSSTPSSEKTSADPPICTFDPKSGEYVCPDPPTCTFDPQRGEYVCPELTSGDGIEVEEKTENPELR